MGNGESQFNVLLIVRDKVTRECPQTTIFEEKGELMWNRTEALLLALPLGQTSSQWKTSRIPDSCILTNSAQTTTEPFIALYSFVAEGSFVSASVVSHWALGRGGGLDGGGGGRGETTYAAVLTNDVLNCSFSGRISSKINGMHRK